MSELYCKGSVSVTRMVHYSRAHYVFRILGFFGSSSTTQTEQWSTGFRLGQLASDVPVGVSLVPFLETVSGAIAAFHSSSSSYSSSNSFLKELTIARVGLDGKYDPESQQTTRRPYSPIIAGVSTAVHPWTTATVISLRTGFPRGIASNGRTYWPTPAANIEPTTGRVHPTAQNNFAAAAKTMIDAINTAANSQIGTLVRVGVMGADGKTGSARVGHVDRIRVDDRLDSIERRENDKPVAWVEKTILSGV